MAQSMEQSLRTTGTKSAVQIEHSPGLTETILATFSSAASSHAALVFAGETSDDDTAVVAAAALDIANDEAIADHRLTEFSRVELSTLIQGDGVLESICEYSNLPDGLSADAFYLS